MKVYDERPSTDTLFTVDLTESESDNLLEYANAHMPEEELIEAKIHWAMIDLLKKDIENTLK